MTGYIDGSSIRWQVEYEAEPETRYIESRRFEVGLDVAASWDRLDEGPFPAGVVAFGYGLERDYVCSICGLPGGH